MPSIIVHTHGDGCWPDLEKEGKQIIHLANGAPPIQFGVLDKGMVSGQPSVAIRIDLPSGRVVIAETSVRLLVGAAQLIAMKYPELFKDMSDVTISGVARDVAPETDGDSKAPPMR